MDRALTLARRTLVAILTIAGIVSIACFVRAHARTDELVIWLNNDVAHRRSFSVFSDRGRIGIRWGTYERRHGFTYSDPDGPDAPRVNVVRVSLKRPSEMILVERPRFLEYHALLESPTETARVTSVCACAPVIALLSVPVPAWALARRARRRALERIGKCPRCGYDLRSSPGGCPECGPTRVRGRMRWNWRRARRRTERRNSANDQRYSPLRGATEFLTQYRRARRTSNSEGRPSAPPGG